MFDERAKLYKKIEEIRGSRVLVYVTGDRKGMETQMHPEVIDLMVEHLDAFDDPNRITLILHSRGGETSAGWSIANLIRSFCKEFEVIIPARAQSAATLLCLGANRIMMTKQATLGPIDPNVNTPLNPQVPGGAPNARVGVSVESIKGYVQLAKEEFGITDSADMSKVLSSLAEKVHPLVLGNVFRARYHIRMLAKSLLEKQFDPNTDAEKIEKIVSFLCSDSGSHDYTINRVEARDKLGLTIEKPDDDLYGIIKKIYGNLRNELELNEEFTPQIIVAQSSKESYFCKRAIIESLYGGTDVFISEGTITKEIVQTPQCPTAIRIQDNRTFEGWRKEKA